MSDTLFEMEAICPRCKGKNKIWDHKLDAWIACPNRQYHTYPERQKVQVAANATDTSVGAARRALPGSGTMRRTILDYIVARGDHGATDEEIEQRLGLRHQSASARRNELARDGWIKDSGTRRKTSSGSDAIVWVTPV